jgi:hypothetical protein
VVVTEHTVIQALVELVDLGVVDLEDLVAVVVVV